MISYASKALGRFVERVARGPRRLRLGDPRLFSSGFRPTDRMLTLCCQLLNETYDPRTLLRRAGMSSVGKSTFARKR
jgi:hypothetical protein